MNAFIEPPPIKPGDTLAFVAPASPVTADEIAGALEYFRRRGFRTVLGRSVFQRDRFLAGTDAERAADFMDCVRNPEVHGILCVRGGYGSMRLLELLDYDAIAANPKLIVGFSDLTALQLAVFAKTGLISFTGSTSVTDFRAAQPPPTLERTLETMFDGKSLTIDGLEPLRDGNADGPLVGGCLSLITRLLGTEYMPDLRGAILFLEDVNEGPYRVDRMLTHLRLAGVFSEIAALLLGEFKGCTAQDPMDGTIDEVLAELPGHLNGPVLSNLPYGHGPDRCILPVGRCARLRGSTLVAVGPCASE